MIRAYTMRLPRFVPFKPRVCKADGSWRVFLPQLVFAGSATGTFHGPFRDWDEALRAARVIADGVRRGLANRNCATLQIGAVN
jgi:hypothetical protein